MLELQISSLVTPHLPHVPLCLNFPRMCGCSLDSIISSSFSVSYSFYASYGRVILGSFRMNMIMYIRYLYESLTHLAEYLPFRTT